jgi:hypothetical protein
MFTSSDSGYRKHFTYPSQEYDDFFTLGEEATDREIFCDEVVIETDLPAKIMNEQAIKAVQQRLKELSLKLLESIT